jgi:hypothetical protein
MDEIDTSFFNDLPDGDDEEPYSGGAGGYFSRN